MRQVRTREPNESEPLMTCREPKHTSKPEGGLPSREKAQEAPAYCLGGVRHKGGGNLVQASVRNVGTCASDAKGVRRSGSTTKARVPMPKTGADGLVVARRPVKAGGAKGPSQPVTVGGQPKREEPKSGTKTFSISYDQVKEAYRRVRANRGAAGVDGESIDEFEGNLEKNLYKIWNRMSSGSYFPQPVKRVGIPKKDGRTRYLGIPTVSDRVAQMVVKMSLEPRVEPHFHKDSYGYRPHKSAREALATARRRCWENDWVIDLDIKGFFDNIDHVLMMRALGHYTQEKWIHLYVRRWLTAKAQTAEGELLERTCGTPQGGVISPVLANIFLHKTFDEWMKQKYPMVEFERYADDIIVHCGTEKQAHYIKAQIEGRFKRCKLMLHPDKTKIVYCKDDDRPNYYKNAQFDFLGYTFRARRVMRKDGSTFIGFNPAMSKKSEEAIRDKMRSWQLKKSLGCTPNELAKQINPALRGWMNYFGSFYPSQMHDTLRYCNSILMAWSMRKYKKLKGSRRKAYKWWRGVSARQPGLFAHWKLYKFSTCMRAG
jgi:RNA-directed DNA polymerase